MMNLKLTIAFILSATFQALAFADGNSIAIIKNFSGNISIMVNNQPVTPAKFMSLQENTTVNVDQDAILVLFLKNGEKMSFSGKAKFKIEKTGIKALDKDTELLMAGNTKNMVYSKRDTLASRGTLKGIPEECQREIDEIEKTVNDPVLKALLKGEVYKRFNLTKLAAEEFNLHKKLTSDVTSD